MLGVPRLIKHHLEVAQPRLGDRLELHVLLLGGPPLGDPPREPPLLVGVRQAEEAHHRIDGEVIDRQVVQERQELDEEFSRDLLD